MDERIIQFRIGVLVVATCIIAAILVVLFGEWPTLVRGQYTVFVRFERAPGVMVDTPIRKSGILIGRVSAVDLRDEGAVVVTLKIDAQRKLRQNETVRITPGNVLLGDTALEFIPSGDPARSSELIPDGFYMNGAVAPGLYDAMNVLVDVARLIENLQDDITLAAGSLRVAGDEVGVMSRNVNTLVVDNQEQLQRMLEKSEQAIDHFNSAMTTLDEFMGEDDLRTRLRESLYEIPDLLSDSRQTLGAIREMANLAEQNLANLEGFTGPLGDRGDELVESIEQSLRRWDQLMVELVQFGQAINGSEGSLGQLVHNRDLYDRLNQAAANIEQISARLRPIVEDARIFTDKVARDPGRLSSGILTRRQSGTKWLPTP
jgi:phospholipid/cholesterol/gamma-HCH transport system substrate-binding protein